MKSNIRIVSVVIFLSIIIMLVSFGEQKTEWKGKIEYEDGIKVIKNPEKPLYGDITFELEEDLSIGREDDDNYMFHRSVSISIDSEENIFVLDRGNYRILKFDRGGNHLQTIGRRGQGPGEFERPSTAYLDSKNNIYVRDSRKAHLFDKSGDFKRTFTFDKSIGQFCITEGGNIFAYLVSSTFEKGMTQLSEFMLLNSEWKVIKKFASYSETYSIGGPTNLGHFYTPGLFFYPMNKELAIYGISSEYRLFVVNSSGDIVYIIEKKAPPRSLTRKEKNKIIEDYVERRNQSTRGPKVSKSEIRNSTKFPKHVYFFIGLSTDDRGRIYVGRFISPLEEKKISDFDLFSKDGYYLYRLRIQKSPRIISNGYMYRSETDLDSGLIKVKRYKIKNWEEIKEGI